MNWKKAIGFGVLIWLVMFAFVSAFLTWYEMLWMKIIVVIFAGVASFVMSRYVKPSSAGQALSYSLCWVIAGLILDFLVTMRFNPVFYTDLYLWLGYAMIFFAPLLNVKKQGIIPPVKM